MLQRAASNAYSWWWASHIRTKQSKWLEQNLQDMEEKVQTVLKLISEDGDSFAKRAEMYYKKRPELIHFVEETYKMYRSLAERYDHISTELQNANNTIASVFPEQVQFAMDEEDDYNTPKFQRKIPDMSKAMNIPKVPQTGPTKDLKSLLTKATANNKLQPQRSMKSGCTKTVAKSGLSKPQGLEEIDKTQKQILSLQTEKEFVKSSYENGLAKYWEIENQIKGMQDKVSGLQDEFGEGMVIDDNEARNLMTAAALKSCQETLVELQIKQECTAEEAKAESQRVKDAKRSLESLKNELEHGQVKTNQEKPPAKDDESANAEKKILDEEVESVTQQRQKLEMLREKIKEHYEAAPDKTLTVTEMADKIDELVTKVISLESAVSSQTALVNRLRGENDEIHEQIRSLEGDKETLIGDKKELSKKLKELEDKLHQVQDLNISVESQSDNLQTHFTEANCNLDHITHKLQTVRPDEDVNATTDSSDTKEEFLSVAKLQKQFEVEDKAAISVTLDEEVKEAPASQQKDEESSLAEVKPTRESTEHKESPKTGAGAVETADVVSVFAGHEGESLPEVRTTKPADAVVTGTVVVGSSAGDDQAKDVASKSAEINTEEKELLDNLVDMEATVQAAKKEDEPDWQKLFANGMGDREKILLTEYTSTLRNYKDLKKKFSEAENELFETSVQIKELKGSSAMKDEEIKALHKKLDLLLQSLGKTKDSEEFRALDQTPSMPKEQTENVETEGTSSKTSAIEEQFRTEIDELLEENLDFWLKFSASFHQVQQFETSVQDLQSEISKLEEKTKKQDGSSTAKYSMKSDARPLYKHLTEIQNELNVWLEKGALLKDELQCRFASLCEIQEEITKALKTSAEDGDFEFTSYQAAKFQGEILNMKQENNKVADELQAGLDHVNTLQIEVERTLTKVNEDYKLAGSKKQLPPQLAHAESRSRVPLRSFIFGVAPKKQRRSFFAVMAPAMHKRYQDSKARSSSSQL